MHGRILRTLLTVLLLLGFIDAAGGSPAALQEPGEGSLDPDEIARAFSDKPEFESRGEGPVLLRYRFRPDEKVLLRSSLVMDQVVFINDQTIKVQTVMSIDGQYTVDSVGEDGAARASMILNRIRVCTKGPSEISFDSKEGKGAAGPTLQSLVELADTPLSFRVSSLGVVSDVDQKPLEAIIKRAGTYAQLFDIRNICEEFLKNVFIELSKIPVKTGDVYKAAPVSRTMPDGGEVGLNEEFKILALSGDNRLALLQPMGRFTIKKADNGKGIIRLNYGAKGGWVLFSHDRGNIVKAGGYSRLDVTFVQKDRSMRMKTEVKMSCTVK